MPLAVLLPIATMVGGGKAKNTSALCTSCVAVPSSERKVAFSLGVYFFLRMILLLLLIRYVPLVY